MLTPNAVDSYSRFMDALFDDKEIYATTTVWQQFFGKPAHAGSKTVYSPNSEVIDIDGECIEPAPEFGSNVNTDFIKGVGKIDEKVVILLDVDKVMSSGEVAMLEQATQN